MTSRSSSACYRYAAYGLTIQTPFACPELMPAEDGPVDVTVVEGTTPERLDDATARGFKFEASPGHVLFRTRRIADFLVSGGERIVVSRKEDGTDDEVRFLLLGWCIGTALHQRGVLPLHGSALVREDSAVVFCAPSGTGKSSTAALLLQRGWQLLDDNIAAIGRVDGAYAVFPGSPTLKLLDDVLTSPGVPGTIGAPVLGKHRVYFGTGWNVRPRPLKRIFILRRTGEAKLRTVSLDARARFDSLVRNTFMLRLVLGAGLLPAYFDRVTSLATELPVSELCLPERRPSPDEILEEVARTLC